MSDNNDIDIDEVLMSNEESRVRRFGDLGLEIDGQSQLYNRVISVLATMDQYDLRETYDPEDKVWNEMKQLRDRIKDDVEEKFEKEL